MASDLIFNINEFQCNSCVEALLIKPSSNCWLFADVIVECLELAKKALSFVYFLGLLGFVIWHPMCLANGHFIILLWVGSPSLVLRLFEMP